ncbi:hypothetical protein EF847_16195 [Actinobacteria bacterium YIM 96077]|uniref:Rpn family recombination-promoting nuclease/putative transposase n=1 Tax=Phytoactinopolyspora halophila TaxID=1981511 RepID=A0A329QD24_9ACTN|nr:hypothetical protein [Phytoactinopolyspora halophila]AYY14015.1 hypothetical protein EF847_16195 [Actinobacteria bacterium YIM 96077]RAW10266.1 hypothetical protein DPM12_19025 [Phytoactinopolyspora halophila]
MPSAMHEALIEMFRSRPSLTVELLRESLGVSVPIHRQIRLEPGDLPDLAPTEYRADAVVVLCEASDEPVQAIVVEVQLGRDGGKRWSWPVYLTTLRARLRCAVTLLVVCVESATADWCGAPIDLGHPGWILRPLVLGPHRVPVVTDVEQARSSPELAVMSAMAHGAETDGDKVLDAVASAFTIVDDEHAALYSDVVFGALPEAARHYLEALMTTKLREYQSDFVRRYVNQGRAEGKAQGQLEAEADAVLSVLAARGVGVPDDARRRISECTDLDQLKAWLSRAATATSIDDIFC